MPLQLANMVPCLCDCTFTVWHFNNNMFETDTQFSPFKGKLHQKSFEYQTLTPCRVEQGLKRLELI